LNPRATDPIPRVIALPARATNFPRRRAALLIIEPKNLKNDKSLPRRGARNSPSLSNRDSSSGFTFSGIPAGLAILAAI
jgi:hypothetical protein